ncbi:hypothetical protein JXA88_03450 [Candidatus Fermentibacteria bacterium]|nr:hypothetical protein [Candidatus Fermentibacteria bacterium]
MITERFPCPSRKLRCVWILVAVTGVVSSSAYEWPVRPRIGQHIITATLGEYRSEAGSTPAHFHNGVDIGRAGVSVYPIEPGVAHVDGAQHGVNIGHFRYYHLDGIPPGIDGTHVETVTSIGTSQTHLHLGECDVVFIAGGPGLPPGGHWLNPLREGGLTPFNDFAQPIIHEARVYRQGTTTQLQGDSLVHLHGPVDVWVNARDPRTSTTGQGAGGCCGAYRVVG